MCMETDNVGTTSGGCGLYNSTCSSGSSAWWRMNFGPTNNPLYPTGYPSPIGAIYYVNRIDLASGTAITIGRGNLTLVRPDGSEAGRYPLDSRLITSIYVNNITLPPPAITIDTATESQKAQLVAAVRIKINQNAYLNFK